IIRIKLDLSKICSSKIYFLKSLKLSVFICVYLWIIFLFSCNYKSTDLRDFAPAETLVYLETNDLQNTLNSMTENEAFNRLSSDKKDFSVLKGVQLSVVVTGFETNEKQVTDSQSILNFKPKFVAIADTHAWEFQTISLTENQISDFVSKTYGGNVKLEKTDKNGGKYFVWTTAEDERKVFAFVSGSLIFFGNDEASIEKCLAAKRGEAENLTKNGELTTVYDEAKNKLAFGFVSSEGIKQIADFAGISAAIETSEDELPRNFIAKVLPQILSKSVKRIVWTTEKNEQEIADNFRFETAKEISDVLKETIVSANQNTNNSAAFLPVEITSATKYNLKNPQIAWRSLLLSAGKQTDEQSAKILIAFSDSFFAPFGIISGETFLNSVGTEILTARFDAEGEKQIAIVTIKNAETLKKSFSPEFKKSENQNDAEIWKVEDEDLTAAFVGNNLVLGDSESVQKCLLAKQTGENFTKSKYFQNPFESRAAVATYGKTDDSAHKIAELLGNMKNKDLRTNSYFLTETRFEGNAFVRKTVSDFGLIGTILEQFTEN
ncbi:MAG: hypothetical protein ABIP06_02585, partial [Pyrinomonadaceae bacterium]